MKMFIPDKDRLNYGNILSPPVNCKLDFAIGTTYSLDLQALISSALSLGLSKQMDSDLINDPIYLLDALRRTSNKIALFCEKGKISLNKKPQPYHILLEDMIFQVSNPKKFRNNFCSFHPKFWLLRFIDDEDESVFYRFIVLSRNLTFDKSWDISFTMDGHEIDEETDKNKPLSKFIAWLSQASKKDNESKKTEGIAKKMEKIAEELNHVKFDLNHDYFEDFDFIINGIDEESRIQNYPLFTDNLDELFIMSPFLSETVIKEFDGRKNQNSKAILITRKMSLDKLEPDDCSNFTVYRIKNDICKGESKISDDSPELGNNNQDIHAKMYLIENEEDTELYLGSLNASCNALHGNVEFMIRLKTTKEKLNIENLIEDVFNGNDEEHNPFESEEIIEDKPPEDKKKKLDLVVKKITRFNIEAKVISNGENYDIELRIYNFNEKDLDGAKIKMRPLFSDRYVNFSNNMKFEKLSKKELTEFFIFNVYNDDDSVETIIKIPVTGMPNDRQKDVISNIIDDEEKFRKFVAFVLDNTRVIQKDSEKQDRDKTDGNHSQAILPELYEKMLKASVKSPDNIKHLDFLIKNVSDDVIPEGFVEIYNTILKVVNQNGGKI